MLFYGCLYIGASGPLIQYFKTFKKFSLGAEFTQSFRPCFPLLRNKGKAPKSPRLDFPFFKAGARYTLLVLLNIISSYWETIGRLGELILMLKKVKKKVSIGLFTSQVAGPNEPNPPGPSV